MHSTCVIHMHLLPRYPAAVSVLCIGYSPRPGTDEFGLVVSVASDSWEWDAFSRYRMWLASWVCRAQLVPEQAVQLRPSFHTRANGPIHHQTTNFHGKEIWD